MQNRIKLLKVLSGLWQFLIVFPLIEENALLLFSLQILEKFVIFKPR